MHFKPITRAAERRVAARGLPDRGVICPCLHLMSLSQRSIARQSPSVGRTPAAEFFYFTIISFSNLTPSGAHARGMRASAAPFERGFFHLWGRKDVFRRQAAARAARHGRTGAHFYPVRKVAIVL